ncbi:MAG TPA: tetratricopeptide repeat protein [Candidatus Angelobacter sp.]|jgi:tetratricopeptide (TPR) repeat protein|nr:tetratricopeptide repeat protein [Candidatus Angelobacter sp.]
MKRTTLSMLGMALVLALASAAGWSQATLARVQGKVTQQGKPQPDMQVVFTNLNNGKTFKGKTDRNGIYTIIGMERTGYQIDVLNPAGEKVYTVKRMVAAEGAGEQDVNIELTEGNAKGGASKEQIDAIKAQNAKAESMNTIIRQVQEAMAQKNWQAAEAPLQQLIAADPSRYEYPKALGDVQLNLGKYEEAIQNYEKGAQLAKDTKQDPKNPASDPAKIKTALTQIYSNEGSAYSKLKKGPEAVAAYTKAAELDPNPGTAYFNICATQYNSGNTDGALAACDKAIAADPKKADAYFIKGSLMMGQGKLDSGGKYTAPEGTAEALNKYLELAPDGQHANDVKQMLTAIGAKIETNYKSGKKK